MQPYYYARTHRAKRPSAFLPFVSLIVIVLIGVLVFQIFSYFSEKRRQAIENKAAVEIISGRGDLKIWGVDEWVEARTGSILHEGDSFKTSAGSRVVLSLLNGSTIRLGSESEIELTDLKTRDGQDELGIKVVTGDVWLKRSENLAVSTSFAAETEHLQITSLGTIFDVSVGARESVRVLEGTVQAVIRVPEADDTETIRIADTVQVAFGQEVSIGQDEVRQLQNRRPVQLLALLSDTFRDTEWYKWNRLQDSVGQAKLSVEDAVSLNENPLNTLSASGTLALDTSSASSTAEVSEVFNSPIITAPAFADRTTKNGTITISGSVSAQTQKLEVTTYIGGKPEAYLLQKYKAGTTQWSYVASNTFGNLVAGDNRLSFVAIDKDGNRSEPAEIVVRYDKPLVEADLSAPVVISYNGQTTSDTTEDSVLVNGKIGQGIVKVFVNDFALSRYVPDSGTWSYYAKKELGNLNVGANTFTVYGITNDGRKTPVTTFTITKTPAAGTNTTPQVTPAL